MSEHEAPSDTCSRLSSSSSASMVSSVISAFFQLSPRCLAQNLSGLMAGVWLSRNGEWSADWQARSPEGGLGSSVGAVDVTLSDAMLLPAMLLSILVLRAVLQRSLRMRAMLIRPLAALWAGLILGLLHQPLLMPEALAREEVWLEGRIESLDRTAPSPRESSRLIFRIDSCRLPQGSTEKGADSIDVKRNAAGRDAACQRLDGQRVQLRRYWPRKAGPEHVAEVWHAGERWRLLVRMVPPVGASNPGAQDAFDRVAWLWRDARVATGYVRQETLATRVMSAQGLAALRLGAEEVLWHGCNGGHERIDWATTPCRWLAALTLGKASALTRDDWDILNATGLTHLAVVSGLHVGLMASLVLLVSFTLLRWWRPLDWRFSIHPWWLACLAAWGFALLAGLAPPALRAALMASVGLWLASGRSGLGVWQVWMLALLMVLLSDPLALWRPGTWLSFLAVATLLLAWQGRVRPRGARGWCLATARSQWLLTLVMGAALLVWRGQLSPLSLPLNLLMAPLVTLLVVPLGMLGWGIAGLEHLVASSGMVSTEVIGKLSGPLWQMLSQGMAQALEWVAPLAERHGQWPGHQVHDQPRGMSPALVKALAVMVALCAWLAGGVPGLETKIRRACAGLALMWGLALAVLMIRDEQSRPEGAASAALVMTVHDVGQGLAVSLEVAAGTQHAEPTSASAVTGVSSSPEVFGNPVPRYWRYDLGAGSSRSVSLQATRLPDPRTLQGIIVSHADNDHAGGLAALLPRQVAELWVPAGQHQRLARHARWLSEVPVSECVAGRKVALGLVNDQPLSLEVLWPPSGLVTRRANAQSCVILVAHAGRPLVVLSGDIRQQEERQLTDIMMRRLAGRPLPVLLVAHHGSRSSSDEHWLAALAARHVIVSAGRYNAHGHPHAEVVRRLAQHAQCLWHTGLDGALRWEWSGSQERLVPARGAFGIGVRCLGVKSVD